MEQDEHERGRRQLRITTPPRINPSYAPSKEPVAPESSPDYRALETKLLVIGNLIDVDFKTESIEDIRVALQTGAINLQKTMQDSLPLFNSETQEHINNNLLLSAAMDRLNDPSVSRSELEAIHTVLNLRIRFLKSVLPN